MRICMVCAVIIVLVTNDACADEKINQNNLITTYDPGEATTETPNRRLSNFDGITADNQSVRPPENPGRIKFEGQSSERPIKFEDGSKEHGYIDIDKADPDSLLVDISFDKEDKFDRNDRISNTRSYEVDTNNSGNRIKFESGHDESENSDDQENNDSDDDFHTDASQVVFEDNDKGDENDSDYSDESELEADTTDKPIKFENQDNESNSNNRDPERNPVTERVIFKDDSNTNQETNQKKKSKPRRKPRFEAKQTNPAPLAPNSPYAGLGYPGYPGVGYPGPGYPGPGDPNTRYPSYPTPGYPAPGYPYSNYPSPYPGMVFPTPAHSGYSPYPTMYPPMSPGYGAYPTSGFHVPGDQRPPTNPTAYPSPGQGDPNGHTDTRYPSQEYAGTPSPGAPQGGQPGPSYSEYPYYQGYPVPGYPPPYLSDPNAHYPPQNQAPYVPPVYPGTHPPGGYSNGPQRPSRRPKSLTQRAVSAVAEALTSIALYDDYQCVPRILCEVAGGSITATSPALLKASSSLQPLLSLLQSYNGVSSSPLFLFGRAAVTGMTAKGNPSACYRAYPQCPSDPEKLINYLNNHNGGFFRFFGQPETPHQQQNLEQFYNYLSGQNSLPQQPQQNYGYQKPMYGYGFLPQHPYAHPYNYGHNYYNEQIGYRNAKKIESEVEERIQNKPGGNVIAADSDLDTNESQDKGSKWSFPDEGGNKKGNEREIVKIKKQPERQSKPERPSRGSKTLKFPDDRSDDRRQIQLLTDYSRKQKYILFPGQTSFQIYTNYQTTTPVNPGEYYFDHKHNFYVKRPKALKTDDVVYVVRGNGDPNNPEIVRVKPGQSI